MGLQAKNYTALSLSGTMTTNILGDGVSANTVHQIYCLSAGSISITAMGGGTFTWTPTANNYLDIVPSSITVNSGAFIGFIAKDANLIYTRFYDANSGNF
jgi:hypothetical protein